MSDIRNLDLTATDKGLKVNQLIRQCKPLAASTTYNEEFVGFFVNLAGSGDWTMAGIDANVTHTFGPASNTTYWLHVSTITLPAGASGHGFKAGIKTELVDQISTWTVDGDGDLTGGVLTVPSTSGSSALTSDSSVLPVEGDNYSYEFTISSFGAATQAIISYGGVEIWDETESAGTFTGKLTTTSAAGLVVDVDVATGSDFVLDNISIKRAN